MNRTTLIATLVLPSAFLLRYIGITFGFPLIVHPDEPETAGRALQIISTGDWNPHSFFYPTLNTYVMTVVFKIVDAFAFLSGQASEVGALEKHVYYYWGRMATILFSLGTIWCTYIVGLRLFGTISALAAMSILSFSSLHISNSFVITPNSPMAFWVILSFLVSARIYLEGPRLRYYILNGIFIGCAVGTKYAPFFLVLPLIYAHLCHRSFSLKSLFDRELLIAGAIVPVAFLCTTPYALLDHHTFLAYMKTQQKAYSQGHVGFESDVTSYTYYLTVLADSIGHVLCIMAGLGSAIMFVRERRTLWLLLLFPLPYFLLLGSYKTHFARNVMCIVPFLALLAGYGTAQTLAYIKSRFPLRQARTAAIVIVILSLGYGIYGQIAYSLHRSRQLTLPDTRWLAKMWIDDNLPPGTKIGREFYTPPIDDEKFQVVELGYFGLISMGPERHGEGFDYYIASSGDYQRFFSEEYRYPLQAEYYRKLFSQCSLLMEWKPEGEKSVGPVIKLLQPRTARGKEGSL